MICNLVPHTLETASPSVSLPPIIFGTSLHAAPRKRFRECRKKFAARHKHRELMKRVARSLTAITERGCAASAAPRARWLKQLVRRCFSALKGL